MIAFILGAIIGSFLNVIIIRTPKNLSIVKPRSHCPKCQNIIPFYFNIPIISYLLLRGKCYFCKTDISAQYCIVELLSAIIFMTTYSNLPIKEASLLSLVFSILTIIAFIDLKYFLIPTYLIILLYISLIPRMIFSNYTITALFSGGLGVGLYLILCSTIIIIKKKTLSVIGLGDILLTFFVGAWFGIINGLYCLFIASIVGVLFILIKKESQEKKIPFGLCISISFLFISILEIYECNLLDYFNF